MLDTELIACYNDRERRFVVKKQKGCEPMEKFPILVAIGTDTASKLGLSKSALYRLAHSAEGQALTVRVGGRLLFKRDALLEFLGVNGKEE